MSEQSKWVGQSVTILGALLVILSTGGVVIGEETRQMLLENFELLLVAGLNVFGAIVSIYGRLRKKGGQLLTIKPGSKE